MTRVIHTGDTHLGYRQYHSPERRSDFLAAFRRVAEDALAEDVAAVIHAGDLFHDRRPDLRDVYGAIEVLRDLRDGDIPFLAVVGNHERTSDHQWLDLFETLGLATRLGHEPVVVDDVAFYGQDFVPRARRSDLAYDFQPHDADHAALVSHGLFTPFNTDWDLSAVLEGSPVDFDVVLLGDDHHPDTAEVDGTWVTYCGSTERVSAAEREDRGYNIVEFDGTVSIRRRGIETRDFVILDLELGPGEGTERVTERLGQESLDDAVVVVGIEGDGGAVAPAEVESFARDRGALVARVNDRREFEAAETVTVEFADPDSAVVERLREMGPSAAALQIDDVVRSGAIPDSNVRDRVTESVKELLDTDPGAFEPGTATPPDEGAKESAIQDRDDSELGEPAGDCPSDSAEASGVTVDEAAVALADGATDGRPVDMPDDDPSTGPATQQTAGIDADNEPDGNGADTSDADNEPDGDGPDTLDADDGKDSSPQETDEGNDDGRPTTMEDFL